MHKFSFTHSDGALFAWLVISHTQVELTELHSVPHFVAEKPIPLASQDVQIDIPSMCHGSTQSKSKGICATLRNAIRVILFLTLLRLQFDSNVGEHFEKIT
jgi:hypothetical protein